MAVNMLQDEPQKVDEDQTPSKWMTGRMGSWGRVVRTGFALLTVHSMDQDIIRLSISLELQYSIETQHNILPHATICVQRTPNAIANQQNPHI